MIRPQKPHPDFPLSANLNGQWWKKVNQKPYYFGSWKADPKGEAALRDYNDRIAGILAGTDHLRALEAKGGVATVGGMMKLFLEQFRLEVAAGTRAKGTLGDYINELRTFTDWVKPNTAVAALKPEHFAGYVKHLMEVRGLKARARKRVQAYVKAMFRWAAGNGHAPLPNFGSAMKAPSTTKQAIRKEKARMGLQDFSDRIVSGAEVDMLLAKAQPNFRAMILLGINCGLGPADLGRLRWRHFKGWDATHDEATVGRKLVYPRGKNGNERVGWLWKKTVEAIDALRSLKHTRAAIAKDGMDALVFITRKQQPYFWEEERKDANGKLKIVTHNAISLTVSRLADRAGLEGVTHYRLRHSFKTYGKGARDRDALNLCMGHQTNTVQDGYDHDEISWKRIKRVVRVVRHRLWPELKRRAGSQEQPQMRIVGGDQGDAAVRKAG